LISNMFLLAFGLHGKIMRNERLVTAVSDRTYDWDNIAKNKKKLAAMRSKRAHVEHEPAALDLEAFRNRVNSDKPKSDGRCLRDRHKSAMNHWFKKEGLGDEEVIAKRLSAPPTSRLPALEPLPSSEDSFLAFTCDDEILFDAPVHERWKDYVDEKTAVVPVAKSGDECYSFAGEALFAGQAIAL